jgi:hypothetical protein
MRILKIDFSGDGDWRQSSSSFSTFLDHRLVSGGSSLGRALIKTSKSHTNFSSGQAPDPYLLLLPGPSVGDPDSQDPHVFWASRVRIH